MVKYINFGECYKPYKFIFLIIFFLTVYDCLPSSLFIIFPDKRISRFEFLFQYKHSLFNLYASLGVLPLSYILYKYEKKLTENESNIGQTKALISNKGCFKSIKLNEEKNIQLNK